MMRKRRNSVRTILIEIYGTLRRLRKDSAALKVTLATEDPSKGCVDIDPQAL